MNGKRENLVSVIIPAIYAPESAGSCIDQLGKQSYKQVEIIVLAKPGYKAPESGNSSLTVLNAKTSEGRLGLLKQGLEAARGSKSVWIDPRHAITNSRWLKNILSPFQEPAVGAVTASSKVKGHVPQRPSVLLSLAVKRSLTPAGKRKDETLMLSLSCDAFRTDLLKEILSGSREDIRNIPFEAEPLELALQIKQKGYKIICQPQAASTMLSRYIAQDKSLYALLGEAFRHGEADSVIGKRWGIDWLHARIYSAAIFSLLLIPVSFISLPLTFIAAGLLFIWGWFAGFHLPLTPWEWPVAIFNLAVYLLLLLILREDWAPFLFQPDRWHPAIIRQWLFVYTMPLSYLFILLAAGITTGIKGIYSLKHIILLPPVIFYAVLWHLIKGLGYVKRTVLKY